MKPPSPVDVTSCSAAETRETGARIAALLEPGDLVLLHGELGAGKTVFVQGLARGLGVTDGVTSPTFAVVSEHDEGRLRLLHVDLYRLEDRGSAELGLEDELDDGGTVAAIEWAERGAPSGDALEVTIEYGASDSERQLTMVLGGPSWEARRGRLLAALAAEAVG